MRTQATPKDIEGVDLEHIIRMVHAVPESVNWPSVSNYIWARRLLDDGASLREAARTTGVSTNTMQRWFPGRGWVGDGSSSAFLRRAKREIEGL